MISFKACLYNCMKTDAVPIHLQCGDTDIYGMIPIATHIKRPKGHLNCQPSTTHREAVGTVPVACDKSFVCIKWWWA